MRSCSRAANAAPGRCQSRPSLQRCQHTRHGCAEALPASLHSHLIRAPEQTLALTAGSRGWRRSGVCVEAFCRRLRRRWGARRRAQRTASPLTTRGTCHERLQGSLGRLHRAETMVVAPQCLMDGPGDLDLVLEAALPDTRAGGSAQRSIRRAPDGEIRAGMSAQPLLRSFRAPNALNRGWLVLWAAEGFRAAGGACWAQWARIRCSQVPDGCCRHRMLWWTKTLTIGAARPCGRGHQTDVLLHLFWRLPPGRGPPAPCLSGGACGRPPPRAASIGRTRF